LTCVGEDKTDLSSNALTVLERGSSIQTSVFGPHDADEAGEGGLVWLKSRSSAENHILTDSARGVTRLLNTNNTNAEASNSDISAFNSDGFSLQYVYGSTNTPSTDYVSWTFRKAPKFFDVVTYTGDGVAGREIAHNLGTTVGTILIKRLNSAVQWVVYHRSLSTDATYGRYSMTLNTTAAEFLSGYTPSEPTTTHFTISSNNQVNASGGTYVAYLFAHNDGDGEFGPDGDADIIKCGSFNRAGAYASVDVNLGFEPQFLIVKTSGTTGNWKIVDNMRGMTESSASTAKLYSNDPSAEVLGGDGMSAKLNATGFSVADSTTGDHIYIAIRRGPMAVPESATDVFDVQTYTGNSSTDRKFTTGFPIDANLTQGLFGASACLGSRLIDGMHLTSSTAVSYDGLTDWIDYDFMEGFEFPTVYGLSNLNGNDYVTYNWRRAPNYFDVVAYTGDGVAGRTVSHNLGVAPEMIWVKRRSNAEYWPVLHKDGNGSGSPSVGQLESTAAFNTGNLQYTFGDDTVYIAPDASGFTVSDGNAVNRSGDTYIAYLFASLDGVSKVGSFTTTGSDVNVDCGFSSGARFVLWKRTDSAGSWNLMDSERGIVAGNDPFLNLNQTSGENNSVDLIDPYSSGFTVAGGGLSSGGTYIFYAIA
jgi:hypothetical protein